MINAEKWSDPSLSYDKLTSRLYPVWEAITWREHHLWEDSQDLQVRQGRVSSLTDYSIFRFFFQKQRHETRLSVEWSEVWPSVQLTVVLLNTDAPMWLRTSSSVLKTSLCLCVVIFLHPLKLSHTDTAQCHSRKFTCKIRDEKQKVK